MGKIWVEVSLISARGLRHSSSLWKHQWYAVGWIDPSNKYCTKIDARGNGNPVWNTKFATLIDESKPNFKDLALNVEVYSREPFFLAERLQGTATIVLKEFMTKYNQENQVSRPKTGQVGSYQLRKKRNSSKPQGFIDISIHISQEMTDPLSYPDEGITITLATEDGPGPAQAYDPHHRGSVHKPDNQLHTNIPIRHSVLPPTNYFKPSATGGDTGGGPSHSHRTPPPPPPLPPSNVGYIPTFIPRTDRLQETYINMRSSGAAFNRNKGPGAFGMGLGAGALAAGAVIFGDDFMSGFDVPSGLQDASLTITNDPPF